MHESSVCISKSKYYNTGFKCTSLFNVRPEYNNMGKEEGGGGNKTKQKKTVINWV